MPWSSGKALAWDATIACTLAESYIDLAATQAGSAAASSDTRKVFKYSGLPPEFVFQPLAFESLGAASASTSSFLSVLGRRISLLTGDPREEFYLRQRISVCLQRFNSILLFQSFIVSPTEPD